MGLVVVIAIPILIALFSGALFLLLVVIALTSIIAALEALTSAAAERLGVGRTPVAVALGTVTWTLGLESDLLLGWLWMLGLVVPLALITLLL